MNAIQCLYKLSIKRLTVLGFALVITPLIAALIYSAIQINLLSNQGSNAIFDVANLTSNVKAFTESRIQLERHASQYVILQDEEVLTNYLTTEQKITQQLIQFSNEKNSDALHQVLQKTQKEIKNIDNVVTVSNNLPSEQVLTNLATQFITLATLNNELDQLINNKIKNQASNIKASAEHINLIILKGLFIIPISLVIAAIFIVVISTPLKKLTLKIQRLEKGNFNHKIMVEGSIEIVEIAHALDTMRQHLHALELQKSSFIRHISHELKTPLAAIREGSELLYENAVGELNQDQHEISDIIRMNGTKLQRLIEDLLDFNVVLDSTSLQNIETLNLTDIIRQVVQERKLDLQRKNINIQLSTPEIQCHSNPKQLTVILDNLLSNAIKYSPENSQISIHTQASAQRVSITIADQGMGIAPEIQKKIFDAFYQGPLPNEQTVKSSGLGLTIVKELVMRLNGSVQINSQTNTPSGTQITIQLPKTENIQNNHQVTP